MFDFESIIRGCVAVGILFIPVLFAVRILVALFSPKLREIIRKRKLFHACWLAASILIVIMLFDAGGPHPGVARRAKTYALMEQIQTAILNYQTEYGVPPAGNDNAILIRVLEGDNPRKIEFLSLRPVDTNAKGE